MVGDKRLPRYFRTKVRVPEFSRIKVLQLGKQVASGVEKSAIEKSSSIKMSSMYGFISCISAWSCFAHGDACDGGA